jgi:hypothetical protein
VYVTFAGRFLGLFLAAATGTAVFACAVVTALAGVAELDAGLEMPTGAGFEDCSEHALIASKTPSIATHAIIANFCWRDQDEKSVPKIVWFVT